MLGCGIDECGADCDVRTWIKSADESLSGRLNAIIEDFEKRQSEQALNATAQRALKRKATKQKQSQQPSHRRVLRAPNSQDNSDGVPIARLVIRWVCLSVLCLFVVVTVLFCAV